MSQGPSLWTSEGTEAGVEPELGVPYASGCAVKGDDVLRAEVPPEELMVCLGSYGSRQCEQSAGWSLPERSKVLRLLP